MILRLATVQEKAQVIPLLAKEGLGVVGRGADAELQQRYPSCAEERSHSHVRSETQEQPAKDGRRREDAKKMLNLEGTI
jgi:hypothetical protein